MQSKETRKTRLDGILEIIRHEPMNRRQLQTATGYAMGTIDDYLQELKRKKLIYVAHWVRTAGQQSPYWQTGNKENATKPPCVPQYEKNKKCQAKKAKPKPAPVSIKTPRRDIAASWF